MLLAKPFPYLPVSRRITNHHTLATPCPFDMATPLTNSGKTVSQKDTGQISISIASIFHTLFPIGVTKITEYRCIGEAAPIALRTETAVDAIRNHEFRNDGVDFLYGLLYAIHDSPSLDMCHVAQAARHEDQFCRIDLTVKHNLHALRKLIPSTRIVIGSVIAKCGLEPFNP